MGDRRLRPLFLKSISKFFVSRCISVSSPSGGGAARPSPPRAETPQRAAGEGDMAGRGAGPQHGGGGSRAVRLKGKALVFFLTGNVTNGPYCLFLFWCKFLQVLRLELLHRSRIAAIPSTSVGDSTPGHAMCEPPAACPLGRKPFCVRFAW